MGKILDYTILGTVGETSRSVVYRCRKETEEKTVIIKVLKAEYPTPSEIARFKQEYELIRSIDIDGVVRTYDIIDYESGFALILEDFDGISLKETITGKSRDIMAFLRVAIKLANIIGHLHQKNIIHKDIKPQNILINTGSGEIKITDFGIATVLTHENEEIYNPDVINGTLPYMSPEQTGRMNCSVDYRTDLYSLGVTLYEMLTGTLPFRSKDPMELIHAHLAVSPVPPSRKNRDVPPVLSNIIMKLLLKNCEERYRNAFGLLTDLEDCRQQYEKKGTIELFEPGRHDAANRFFLPRKLFGREKELDVLLSVFESTSAEFVLVAGAPGVGKSALVNEIRKPVNGKRGYFISGKYDRFNRDAPYSSIIPAFKELVKQVLAESSEKINALKDAVLGALGPNGEVITAIIPEVELIIGKQPPLRELEPEEARNRFTVAFEKFAAACAGEEHPIVLFLDDLQWADWASLRLLRTLATSPDIQHLLIIGAYRDTEVDESHMLAQVLTDIERTGKRIHRLLLTPLGIRNIKNLMAFFLQSTPLAVHTLAEVVHRKTGGNPFFVNRFLHTLYSEKLLEPYPAGTEQGPWRWDMDKIEEMQVTDNVADLMAAMINKLPEHTREVLKTGSCMGNRFKPEILALINGISIDAVLRDLDTALTEGLVTAAGDDYIFYHDRIREAAYSLIPGAEQTALHYRIGKIMRERMGEEGLAGSLFYIVDQLNLGSVLLAAGTERLELARLNYKAGHTARASAAYPPAFAYYASGIALLEKDCWEKEYDLALSLYTEAAETACFFGDIEQMLSLSETVITRVRSVTDSIRVYKSRINAYTAQEDFKNAISTGVCILRSLGMKIPENPSKITILWELLKTKLVLAGKSPEDLAGLPPMTDAAALSAMQIFSGMGLAAYISAPALFPVLVLRSIRLALQYGHAPEHSFMYCFFGVLLLVIQGDIDRGYRFGNLGLQLLDKLDARAQRSKTLFVYNGMIRYLKEDLRNGGESLLEGYRVGLETGDLENASYGLFLHDAGSYRCGMELEELEQNMSRHYTIIKKYKQKHILQVHAIYWQGTLNLLGESDNPADLNGRALNEEEAVPLWVETNQRSTLANFYSVRLELRYLFGEYFRGLEDLARAEEYLDGIPGAPAVRNIAFYGALTRLALYPEAEKREKKIFLKEITRSLKNFEKWAHHAPMNDEYRFCLIKAEVARIQEEYILAEDYYERAIKLAKKYNYYNLEALSRECAARYYLTRGKETIAGLYLAEAYSCYTRWGALAKLYQLGKCYPNFLEKNRGSSHREVGVTVSSSTTTSSGNSSEVLDLTTVIKASHAISGEIDFRKLLITLMKITMENAGAEKSILMLPDEGRFRVEAEGTVHAADIQVLQSIPVDAHEGLSSAIVNYIIRTRETLILNNAAQEGTFVNDPYVLKNNPKSILCAPMLKGGKISGILYLENNLTIGAFTPERLELLKVLSSQAAISIDNARLYSSLEEKVRERTSELADAYEKLKTTLNDSSILVSDIGHKFHNELWPFGQMIMIGKTIMEEIEQEGTVRDREFIDFAKDTLAKCEQGLDKIEIMKDKIKRNFGKRAEKVYNKIKIILNNLLDSFEDTLAHEKITLEKEFDFESNIEIKINTEQLEIVLENLINNSIQALKSEAMDLFDKRERKIIVTAHGAGNAFIITVEDNGPGIPEKIGENIFSMFYTSKDGKGKQKKGMGLGLHLTRWIVESCHGGKIELESEEGVFTRFTVTIPKHGGMV
ncbi:MAG: AAA family ATPase [bacterium]|nr:AAA family ATPase [bacterium]